MLPFKNAGWSLLMMIVIGLSGSTVSQAITLQAGVEQVATQPMVQVVEATTGQPIAQATVQVPAQQWQGRTNRVGQLPIPTGIQLSGTLVGIVAQGYEPRTLQLKQALSWPVTIALKKARQSWVLSDSYLRLGDGAYSLLSAGAQELMQGNWQLAPAQPTQSISKLIPAALVTAARKGHPITLHLGSVVGLDTAQSRRAGQSMAPVVAGPLQVWWNQHLLTEIALNGDNRSVVIPVAWILEQPQVVVSLNAGTHVKGDQIVDYDDAGVLHLTVSW